MEGKPKVMWPEWSPMTGATNLPATPTLNVHTMLWDQVDSNQGVFHVRVRRQ